MLKNCLKFIVMIGILVLPWLTMSKLNAQSTQTGSVGIEGTIPTNAPKIGATISVPVNGQNLTNLPVNVSGICPDGLLVRIFKNNVFAGATECSGGSFIVPVDLFNGQNDLVARVYDALEQAGPDSNTVSVTFTETGFNTSGPRISITSNYAKRGANPGDTLVWPIQISGGITPYAINVDWGDGESSLLSRPNSGAVDLTHIYKDPGTYIILIKASDASGATAYLQLVGIANGALSETTDSDKTIVVRERWVWWPLVIAEILVIVSFWLGRRHQINSLRRK
jgi:hypothetical protein